MRLVPCLCIVALLLSVVSIGSISVVNAQDLGIAFRQQIEGADVKDGHIVSFSQNKYRLASESYDKSMVGVVNTTPAIEAGNEVDTGGLPLITQGITQVLVSTKNGPIKAGDIITSSDIPGVGMKSNKSGFILGIAQADYSNPDPAQAGLIPVALTIKFAFVEDSPESEKIGSRLLDLVKLSTVAAYESPLDTLRYVLASVIVIASIGVTFFTTGKGVRNGIEAVGRNPLASKTIMSGVVLNLALSLVITAGGLAAAYIVTTL